MSPIYLLITGSYILLVFACLHFLKKHNKPDWWTGIILALYTGIIIVAYKSMY